MELTTIFADSFKTLQGLETHWDPTSLVEMLTPVPSLVPDTLDDKNRLLLASLQNLPPGFDKDQFSRKTPFLNFFYTLSG